MVKSRKGIAMIELIFSIVIMGIVLMSAPMLIQQSIKSGNVALQQEAIAAAASQISIILSMHWDENGDDNSPGVSPMLDINRAPFDFSATTPPVGINNISGRSSIQYGVTRPATVFSDFSTDVDESDSSKFDDIDDYHNSTLGLEVLVGAETSADVGDYVDVNLTMSTLINYTEDRVDTADITALTGTTIALNNNINNTAMGVASTNIKFIQVTLTSDSGINELNKSITLQAFSSNIGTFLPQGEDHL